jgi:GNAT superfamily N-acetyltransferase
VKATVLQPGYLPWQGYFEQMAMSELFVLLDDVQYTKNDWRNRNRILDRGGQPLWLTVPVLSRGSFGQSIRHALIDNHRPWARKHWRTIEQTYGDAPHFERFAARISDVYQQRWDNLCELDVALIEGLAELLGLEPTLVCSSDLGIRESDPNLRMLKILQAVGADELYEGAAGRGYLDVGLLARSGISTEFQDFGGRYYPQTTGRGRFVSKMSVVDLLMNMGPASMDVLTGKVAFVRPDSYDVLDPDGVSGSRRSLASQRGGEGDTPPRGEDGREPGGLTAADWDSRFFDMKIARLVLSGWSENELVRARDQAVREGIACVFAEAPSLGRTFHDLAESRGYRLVDSSAWMVSGNAPVPEPPPDVSIRPGTLRDLKLLEPAIDRLSPWSRFAADERFGLEVARRVYQEWVRSSADHPERTFMVAEFDGVVGGFVTCEASPQRRLTLIASMIMGAGIGKALVCAALAWRAETDPELRVKVSVRNLEAIRLYERCGLVMESLSDSFHLWPESSQVSFPE